jgi:NSS family neurotransmitter:Na+ symporter
LVFKTLPIAFGQMPGGAFFGSLFFILLVFAAWTSAISLIEPAVAYLVENKGQSRVAASVWCGIATWLLGLGTVFSFNLWSGYKLFNKYTFFDIVDFLTSNIMLPVGGLMLAVFAAWLMSEKASRHELAMADGTGYRVWHFLVRYITPIAVVIVFLHVTGVFGWLQK